MTYHTGMRGAVCLAALLAGGMAHADVTAQQVWDDWKSQMSLYGEDGLSIGGEESSSGIVTVRDVNIRFSDEDVTVDTALGDLVFNEQSDGTVRVTMADSYPITITGEDGVVINVEVSQTNLEMIVSGDPDAMDFDLSADQYKIALVDVVNGDVTFTGDAQLSANNVSGSYTTELGDMRETTYDFSVDLLDLLVDFQIPSEGGYVTAAAKYNNMTATGNVVMPLEADFENPEDLFQNGFGVNGGYVIESADFVIDMDAEGDSFAASGTNGEARLNVRMDNQLLSYEGGVSDLAVAMQTSEFPLPIEFSLAEYGIGLTMPTGKSDEAADFGFSIDLVDLSLSDGIWGLFDPGAALPRDPATIQLALSGKAKALIDMFDPDPEAMMANADMPYELQTANIDKLNISVAGAQVEGEGAFTFDNTDMQTFAPMPAPTGEARIEIKGLNGLLDNLVSAGLVPEEQVMGPRMMMGMFMRNTGDDQMETTLEVSGNGEVKVNGNRVR